jgi:hypothetical protein
MTPVRGYAEIVQRGRRDAELYQSLIFGSTDVGRADLKA